MADGGVAIAVNVNADRAEKELDKVARKIDTIKSKIEKASDLRSPLAEQAAQLAVELDKANAKLYEMQQAASGQYGAKQLAGQKELVRSLAAQYSTVQTQVEKYDRQIQNANYDLDRAKEQYGDLALQISRTSGLQERMAESVEKMQKGVSRFAGRLRTLFRRILFFGLISRGLSNLRDWLGKTIQQNDAASAAVARLKGALLTLAQPILNVVVPAFTSFVNVLTRIVTAIAEFVSILFGSSLAESKKAAESLNDEQKALEGVGSAAKVAEKSMASFDEINQLTASNAAGAGGGTSGGIAADFDSLSSTLPKWLADLAKKLNEFVGDLKIKIKDLKFDWERGNILKNKDAWLIALSGILGAVIGTAFGGITGGVIGLLLGLAVGLVGVTWMDKLEDPGKAKNLAIIALSGMIGAILGSMFGGLSGGIIGLLLGVSIGIVAVQFTDDKISDWTAEDTFNTVMTAILGAILGAAFGSFAGAVIGLLLGASISLIAISFKDKLKEIGSSTNGFFDLMNILLGTIIGAQFGGLAGGVIGLLLGVGISLLRITFSDGSSNSAKLAAAAGLKVLLTTLIFAAIGAAFGFGPVGAIVGGVIGFGLGTLIQLVKISFDDSIPEAEKQKATGMLKTLLYALIGGLIGFAIGGVFGGIVGGIVGIGLGLAIHWNSITYDDIPKSRSGFGGGRSASSSSASPYSAGTVFPAAASSVSLPRLASGAVIPPNREFLAVLGDQKRGTNVEAPADLIRQMVREELRAYGGVTGNRQQTVILQVDHRELGRVVYQLNNEETQRVGVRLAGAKA